MFLKSQFRKIFQYFRRLTILSISSSIYPSQLVGLSDTSYFKNSIFSLSSSDAYTANILQAINSAKFPDILLSKMSNSILFNLPVKFASICTINFDRLFSFSYFDCAFFYFFIFIRNFSKIQILKKISIIFTKKIQKPAKSTQSSKCYYLHKTSRFFYFEI